MARGGARGPSRPTQRSYVRQASRAAARPRRLSHAHAPCGTRGCYVASFHSPWRQRQRQRAAQPAAGSAATPAVSLRSPLLPSGSEAAVSGGGARPCARAAPNVPPAAAAGGVVAAGKRARQATMRVSWVS